MVSFRTVKERKEKPQRKYTTGVSERREFQAVNNQQYQCDRKIKKEQRTKELDVLQFI